MRRTRLAALAVVPLLLVAACGGGSEDENETDESGADLESVTVAGEFDTEPTVEIDGLDVSEIVTEVRDEGDGPAAVAGTENLVQVSVFNGITGEKLLSSHDNAPILLRPDQPFLPGFDEALDGAARGSRILYAAPVEDALGPEAAPQVGLELGQPLVAVIDLLSVAPTDVLSAPEGETVDPEAGTPVLTEDGDAVTGFDWADVKGAPDELQVITLTEGDGPAIEPRRLVSLNYLGEVFKADEPFDGSYDSGPVTFPIGADAVIDGWDEGLVGVTEGSRVLLVIPPGLGYGETGSGEDIPPNSTLVFVVDVLGVDG